jgi:hypothetical protein
MVVDLDGGLLRQNPTNSILAAHPLASPLALLRERGRRDQVALTFAREGGQDIAFWANDAAVTAAATHLRLGGQVAVMSGAAREVALACLDQLGIAADVYGSDPVSPMTEERKERIAIALFGLRGFHFVGPARSALSLAASRAVLVGGTARHCAALRTGGIAATTMPREWRMVSIPAEAFSGQTAGPESVNQQVSREIWTQSGDFARPAPTSLDSAGRRH